MRAKKLLTSRQIFRYAVPARTVTKKALAEGSSHAKASSIRSAVSIEHRLVTERQTDTDPWLVLRMLSIAR